jgi:hypothetical protein
MLMNTIEPLSTGTNDLKHEYPSGYKAYGLHLHPILIPARERAPHHHENFIGCKVRAVQRAAPGLRLYYSTSPADRWAPEPQ